MNIKQVSITLGRTINTGHFESFRVDVSVTCEIEEGDDFDEKYELMRHLVYCKLDREVDNLPRER